MAIRHYKSLEESCVQLLRKVVSSPAHALSTDDSEHFLRDGALLKSLAYQAFDAVYTMNRRNHKEQTYYNISNPSSYSQ